MQQGGQTPPRVPSPLPPLPSPRPGWLVVLGGVMAIWAFLLFVDGLSGLRPPPPGGPAAAGTLPAEAAQVAIRRALAQALSRVDGSLMRTHAAAKVLLAGLMLFAVAALATNDRRGRSAALAAAWAGILYHLGSAMFQIFVVREDLLDSAPLWIDHAVALYGGSDPVRARQELLSSASTLLLLVPITASGLGIGFSLILIRFFGGRRGRAFYGVAAVEVPSHRPGV
jgi:hypothetical protein